MEGSTQQAAPPPSEFLKGGWFFTVVGTLISVPVGIRRKSLAPLVFFSGTGAMLDIILATQYFEWQKHEQQRLAIQSGDVILREELQNEEIK